MQERLAHLAQSHTWLYQTEVGGFQFIWRPLTRREFRLITLRAPDRRTLEDLVCNTVVLEPEGLDFGQMPAGLAKNLAPTVLEESGFGDTTAIWEKFEGSRKHLEQFEAQAEATIRAAFPGISFNEMEGWSTAELLFRLAQAEWVLRNIYGLPVSFDKQPDPEQKTPAQLREAGTDPMTTVDLPSFRPPYIERPIIGGTKQWTEEAVYGAVQQQVLRAASKPETESPAVPD